MVILTTPDVNVVLVDFPNKKGNEMVVPNEDGSYTILINASLNYESQQKAFEHAMYHIKNDDFQKADTQEIEYHAHNQHEIVEPASIYLERIKRLQREQRAIKRQIQKDKERVKFLQEHYDMFKLAEHHYLYGEDY